MAELGQDEVSINNKTYKLAPNTQIVEGLIEEFPDNARFSGQQRLVDRRGKSAWLIREVVGEGGAYLVHPEETMLAKASSCETRWGEITQAALRQNSVLGAVVDDGATNSPYRMMIKEFAGDLGWVFLDNSGGTNEMSRGTFDGASVTWQDEGAITTSGVAEFAVLSNLIVLGDRLVFLFIFVGDTAGDWRVATATDWATWTTAVTGVSLGNDDNTVDRTLILTFNPTVTIIAAYDDSAQEVVVYKNTDDWATNGLTTLATIPCGALNSLELYYDLSGNVKPVVGLDNGVWAIDVDTANNEQLIVNLSTQLDANNCKGMAVWNGSLVVPLGNGGIGSWTYAGAGFTSQSIPQPRLPATWVGHVTASVVTEDWLFIGYGGHAGTDVAHIFAIDRSGWWHYITEASTTNEEITHMTISSNDDSTPRLHWFVEFGDDVFHTERPLDNPRNQTVKSAASSAIELPEFGGGMPHLPKLALQWVVDAENLSASTAGEYIDAIYGIDGATPTTDLGDFLSGDKDLVFGSSSEGVEFKTLSLKPTLIRDAGDDTDRIYIRSQTLEYLVLPDPRETYEMLIDVEATAKSRGRQGTVANVLTELRTVQSSKTMVTLEFRGRTAVRVIAEPKSVTKLELRHKFDRLDDGPTVRYIRLIELL